MVRRLRALVLRGSRFYCPLCGRGFRKFLPAGRPPRANAVCPGCGSLERDRLLWVALRELESRGDISLSGAMLHVAPEPVLANKFRAGPDYVSIDRAAGRAMRAMDVTAIEFADETFDAVVCNHVLEHVPDDRAAMSEILRVLKPGGWGSLQVPIKGETTEEDLSITDPAERLRLYGQEDHVRQYGRDYHERLRAAGFDVLALDKSAIAGDQDLAHLAVDCEEGVTLVRRRA